MSTQYCSLSLLPVKGLKNPRRSCKKTDKASENSDLCEVLNNRCGLKANHDQRVRNHDLPKATARKSTRKSAPKKQKSLAPPPPDAKLSKFLENSTRRAQVPARSPEQERMDRIRLGECTPRTSEECESEIPNVCRWDKGRRQGQGECVVENTRAVDGLSARRRDERTALMNQAEEGYAVDRADKVGKVVPNPPRRK